MLKNKTLLLFFVLTVQLFASTVSAQPPVPKVSQISVKGNKLVDDKGEAIALHGMSFFWSQWMGKYFTPNVVAWLKADWNCTVIRAAMGVEAGGYLKHPEVEKQKVITLVDAAVAQGMYVIIDWHDHHAEDHVKESKAFFAEMARRYGDKPNVIYELYNEPLKLPWAKIKSYHQAVIDTIRHYDPDNIIVCGTPSWSQDVDAAAENPLKGNNIAYSLHFYAGTHKQLLRVKAAKALNLGVALFVTEFGTTEASGDGPVDKAETKIWLKFLDDNKISWCNWSVADKAETSAALKPGAGVNGQWPESQLTESGLFIHEALKQ